MSILEIEATESDGELEEDLPPDLICDGMGREQLRHLAAPSACPAAATFNNLPLDFSVMSDQNPFQKADDERAKSMVVRLARLPFDLVRTLSQHNNNNPPPPPTHTHTQDEEVSASANATANAKASSFTASEMFDKDLIEKASLSFTNTPSYGTQSAEKIVDAALEDPEESKAAKDMRIYEGARSKSAPWGAMGGMLFTPDVGLPDVVLGGTDDSRFAKSSHLGTSDGVWSSPFEEPARGGAAGAGPTAGAPAAPAAAAAVPAEDATEDQLTGGQMAQASCRKHKAALLQKERTAEWVCQRPCNHNRWDDVRSRNGIKVLRCRVCQEQFKIPSYKVPRCLPFLQEGECSRVNCELLHVHKKKKPIGERSDEGGVPKTGSGSSNAASAPGAVAPEKEQAGKKKARAAKPEFDDRYGDTGSTSTHVHRRTQHNTTQHNSGLSQLKEEMRGKMQRYLELSQIVAAYERELGLVSSTCPDCKLEKSFSPFCAKTGRKHDGEAQA